MHSDALARAWALKARCYEAWHSAPQQTRDAADELAGLAARHADPAVQALACWTDGIALFAEGRITDSLARLEQAQVHFQALGDVQHAAETQVPQMVALTVLGRWADLFERGRQALATFLAAGDQRSAGKIEINLGTSLSRQDRHAEAERLYRSAARRFARRGDLELALMADVGVANTLTWQFRLEAALRVCQRALRRARDSGYAILHAQVLEAIGRIELNRGRWPEALAALAEALHILDGAGATPHRRLECETALADAYAAVSLHEEALQMYRRIIDTAQALQAPNEGAWATLQHARVLGRCGRHHEALRGLAQARGQYEQLGNVVSVALTDLCEARVRLALGHADEARSSAACAAAALQDSGITGWWLEARALGAAALARGGETTAARAAYGDTHALAEHLPQVAFECHAGLGEVFWAQGDLTAARSELELALQRLDVERGALPADDLRSALGVDAAGVHEALVGVALAEGDPVRLLVDLERGRARALAFGLARPLSRLRHRAQRDESADRLRLLRNAWRDAVVENDAARLSTLNAEIGTLEQALLEEHRRAGLQGGVAPRRRRLDTRTSVLDVAALQRALGPARALTAYQVHGERLLIIVVTNRAVSLREVASAGLDEHVRGLRLQIDALRNPIVAQRHGALLEERLRRHARLLHDRLWAPVEPLLEGRHEVVVVPHGALHDLPFGLLDNGTGWLVQRATLSVAPSAAVWLSLTRRPRARQPGHVVAVGTLGPDLRHAGREIDAVAALYGSAAIALRGSQATVEAVRAAAAASADLLHFACHARFRADNPAFSNLLLSDGPLPVHELARWKLSAQLVVLSACETGVSRIAPGEEALGLVRAVLLAGARSVLATQWAVDDAATADLVQRFHALLVEGQTPARALGRAQAEAAERAIHPYFWGAFTLYGPG